MAPPLFLPKDLLSGTNTEYLNGSRNFLKVLYVICKMVLIVNYFALDEGETLFCRVFMEAEEILFCLHVEFHVI